MIEHLLLIKINIPHKVYYNQIFDYENMVISFLL